MGIFEKASRLKLRWNIRGNNTAEDLWTIPLQELDMEYDRLCTLKDSRQKKSLLVETKQEDEILDLKIEIIKHVVMVRVEEKKKRDDAKANAAYRQKIANIIENKRDQALLDQSIEDLQKMLKDRE